MPLSPFFPLPMSLDLLFPPRPDDLRIDALRLIFNVRLSERFEHYSHLFRLTAARGDQNSGRNRILWQHGDDAVRGQRAVYSCFDTRVAVK